MKKPSPNIVLIVSDDHGREATGCYGNPVIKTPHMDALAAGGTRFTQAFCTTPSCAASRSCILTGQQNHTNGTYGHTHGLHHFAAFDDVVSLPRLLNESGYRTANIGKTHFAPESVYPFQAKLDADKRYGRDDIAMAKACREYIEADGPFFLYWCSFNPHRSGNTTDHPFKPDAFGNPGESFPGDAEQTYDESEVVVPPWLPDTPHTRAELVQYYQSISRLDRGIGQLMEELKRAGKFDNTVIIYISDNGAAFPGSKTTLYEPGMQLPCLVRAPEQAKRGVACNGLVAWYDITPTILDFAGVPEKAKGMFGQSFRRILEETDPADWREEIFAAHTFHEITNYYPMRAIRTPRYKFIWNVAHPLTFSFASDLWTSATWQPFRENAPEHYGRRTVEDYLHRPAFELYDLENDPDELQNLAADPGHRALVESFCEKINNYQRETRDPWLHKWEYE